MATVTGAATAAEADDWTGAYVGGGIGADAAINDISIGSPGAPDSEIASDGLGGGDFGATLKAGLDWQIGSWLVVGAFANYDWSTIETSARFLAESEDQALFGEAKLLDLQRAWAIGGRVGIVVSPATLAYGLLGYTRAKFSDPTLTATRNEVDPFFGFSEETQTVSARLPEFDGIVFGGGFEHRITDSVSLWGEYRQSRFSAVDVRIEEDLVTRFEPTLHVGRVGVSYRFGGTAGTQPADAAPARQWTGTYVGLGLGVDGIAGKGSAAADMDGGTIEADAKGVGGGDIGGSIVTGYDIQAGKFVGGVYVSYDRSAHDVSFSAKAADGDLHLDIPSIGSSWLFAARAGYLISPDVLAYVLAGYSRLEFSDWTASARGFSASAQSPSFDGYTLGLGFEKMITDHLSLRAEYRYSALRAETVQHEVVEDGAVGSIFVEANVDPTVHAVRLLATYRFNTP